MQSQTAVNDNQWHAFKGERYCCRCETGATGAEYASEWGASSCGEANRGECLTFSRNGAEDGRLFIDGAPEEIERETKRLAHGHSILDDLRGQLKSLRSRLGGADRDRMELMQTSIREAEVLLKQEEAWIAKPKPKVRQPGSARREGKRLLSCHRTGTGAKVRPNRGEGERQSNTERGNLVAQLR